MDNNEDFLGNFEKIKNMSSLFGENSFDGADMGKMMENVNMMRTLMGFMDIMNKKDSNEGKEISQRSVIFPPKDYEHEEKEEVSIFASSSQDKMLDAAIPFLDNEYQKNLFVVMHLLQIRRVMSKNTVMIESRSRHQDEPKLRRKKLLGALRPFLETDERKSLDIMTKLLDVRSIMENMEGNDE